MKICIFIRTHFLGLLCGIQNGLLWWELFRSSPYFQNKGKRTYLSHTEYGIKEHHPRGCAAKSKSNYSDSPLLCGKPDINHFASASVGNHPIKLRSTPVCKFCSPATFSISCRPQDTLHARCICNCKTTLILLSHPPTPSHASQVPSIQNTLGGASRAFRGPLL